MPEFLLDIWDFIVETQVLTQIDTLDAKGLFTNPYFLVPLAVFVAYNIYKMSFDTLIITALFLGAWAFCSTEWMQSTIVDGEMQLEKVIPLIAGACVVIGIGVYIIFIRSD